MQKKKLKRSFNLLISAATACFEDSAIGPNLSQALTKNKINNFCLEFNNVSKIYKENLLLGVKIYIYSDDSFFFILKSPYFTFLLRLYCDGMMLNEVKASELFLTLTDYFDIIYFKCFFFNKYLKFNDIFIKKQALVSLASLSWLVLKNET